MESWAGVDYWLDRVGSLFAISLAAETAERFKDKEEQDAVLAALWRVHPDPAKLHIDETKRVQIPSVVRPEKKQPGEVLYRVVFGPPTKDRPKALVTIFFEAENPKSVLEFAPIPPAGYDQRSSKLAKDIGGVGRNCATPMKAFKATHTNTSSSIPTRQSSFFTG